MNKVKIIKNFNNLLKSFLIQISPLVGKNYHLYFNKFIKVNAILPIRFFIENIYKYKDKILKKDENYFNKEDNILNDYNNDEYKLNEIFKLRGIYEEIDNDSKENTWTYLQALVGLTEEYILLSN